MSLVLPACLHLFVTLQMWLSQILLHHINIEWSKFLTKQINSEIFVISSLGPRAVHQGPVAPDCQVQRPPQGHMERPGGRCHQRVSLQDYPENNPVNINMITYFFSYEEELIHLIRWVYVQYPEWTYCVLRQGYTGALPGVRIWTFTSSLMYSMTVFTTIGRRRVHYS